MNRECDRAALRMFVQSMYDIQSVRISVGNRIGAYKTARGKSGEEVANIFETEVFKRVSELEDVLEKKLNEELQYLRIMEWLTAVKQIGPRYSGSLVGSIRDIKNFKTVSSLWAYAGQDVVPICKKCNKLSFQGEKRVMFLQKQADRRWKMHLKRKELKKTINYDEDGSVPDNVVDKEEYIFKAEAYIAAESTICKCQEPILEDRAPDRRYFVGLLLTHDPFLKMTCHKIGKQFLLKPNFYRTIYDKERAKYVSRPGISEARAGNMARRATVKLFLSHLFEMWRRSEGLPLTDFYLKWKLGEDFALHHEEINPPYTEGIGF